MIGVKPKKISPFFTTRKLTFKRDHLFKYSFSPSQVNVRLGQGRDKSPRFMKDVVCRR